ncbi:CCA tRNA nucleotidyltransferase, partial [Treponema pallidum]
MLLEKNEHAVEREEGSVRVFPVCPLLREVSERFIRAGFCIYVVGGAVRDFLLNRSAHDWDLATDAPPERVRM